MIQSPRVPHATPLRRKFFVPKFGKSKMDAFLEKAFEESAVRCANNGERTGGFSKILSHVCLLLLVLAFAHAARNQEWPALLMIAAAFAVNSVSWLLWIGSVIYLLYVGDVFAASVVVLSMVVTQLSFRVGVQNAKRELIAGASGISPFMGMAATPILCVAQTAGLAIGYLTTGTVSVCSWIVFGLAVVYSESCYRLRLYPKWARLHYPLMILWSHFAASAAIRASEETSPVDVEPELCEFVASIFPDRGKEYAEGLVHDTDSDRRRFLDEIAFRNLASRNLWKGFKLQNDEAALDRFIEKVREIVTSEDSGLRVRYVIAAVIENDFGSAERIKYIVAALNGGAR